MNARTEFFIYVALFYMFSFAPGFAGMRQLLQGDERQAVVTLLGSLTCLLMPYLLNRVAKNGDKDDDTNEPDA